MKRNDIYWAQLPMPAGRRPVLLLSRNEAYRVRARVIVAEITTLTRGFSSEVPVGKAEGLPKASVINVESVHTIPKASLVQRIGSLSESKAARVNDALEFVLALAG